MESNFYIKERLFKVCEEAMKKRIQTIEKILTSIEESRDNETKSSVGDKYETGRSMLQIEEENSKTQLLNAIRVKDELMKIDLKKRFKEVDPGSLVFTNKGDYFFSIGLGKMHLESRIFYCISKNSPIGIRMLSKKVGDEFEFKGNTIVILDIC